MNRGSARNISYNSNLPSSPGSPEERKGEGYSENAHGAAVGPQNPHPNSREVGSSLRSTSDLPKHRERGFNWTALGICAALLVAFAALSFTAVITKSATADEPLHAMGAYMRFFYDDFRLNCEDPPLFGYWAMLPHSVHSLKLDLSLPQWQQIPEFIHLQWIWCVITLYRTPPNNPDAFINASRAMMLVLGVGLGAMLAVWSWKLAGPIAAVSATLLYAFDPNFLGHAPLIKNDVSITLVMFATMFTAWSVARHARWWNLLLLALLVGIAANVKFSGLLVGPMVGVCLIWVALIAKPWDFLGKSLEKRLPKFLAALAVSIACAAMIIPLTWASYGFRYAPTPDPDRRLSMPLIIEAAKAVYIRTETFKNGEPPSPQQVETFSQNIVIRTVLSADRHRLMPQAWLAGLFWTYATTIGRQSYLDGQISQVGWWYYFPLAMLYKTPTATLIAFVLAVACAFFLHRRGMNLHLDRPALICIVVPIVIYGLSAITSNLNLGLRHIFPIYPFIYLLTAITAARALTVWPKTSRTICAILALGLIVESVAAYPNYIAFFNTPAGGSRGGFYLLGDSNLDWGQDLLLLQKWQKSNPDKKLYVAYFGEADPRYYLNYSDLPGSTSPYGTIEYPHETGVAAVSASTLQGMYLEPKDRAFYRNLMQVQKPIEVLGGTIYLYKVEAGSNRENPTTSPAHPP